MNVAEHSSANGFSVNVHLDDTFSVELTENMKTFQVHDKH